MKKVMGQIYKNLDNSWGGSSVKINYPEDVRTIGNELRVFVVAPDAESLKHVMADFRTIYEHHKEQWQKDGKDD